MVSNKARKEYNRVNNEFVRKQGRAATFGIVTSSVCAGATKLPGW